MRKGFPAAFLTIFCCFSLAQVQGDQTYPGKIGIGLEGIGGRGLEFVDAAKTLRPWSPVDGGPDPVPLDINGWPLSDARTIFFDLRPTGAWGGPQFPNGADDPEEYQIDVSGRYHLSFTGFADVVAPWGDSDFTIENVVYDATFDKTTAELVVKPGKALVAVDFLNTNGGIRNVRLIRPGYSPNTSQIFHTPFLKALRPFTVMRFMDWTHTNNRDPEYPQITDWDDRKLPGDATQVPWGNKRGGVCWEYVIALANEVRKDIWINIPASATDNYIRKLAEMMKRDLDPSVRIYLEYSNEVWNPLFGQYDWNRSAASNDDFDYGTSNPDSRARYRVAKRIVEIGQIYKQVFGDSAFLTRIFPVMSWWAIQPSQFSSMVAFIQYSFGKPNDFIYAIAPAVYYGSTQLADASVGQLLDSMKKSSDDGVRDRTRISSTAQSYGLKLFCYEGGPDSGGGSAINVENRIRAHRDPRIKEVILHDFRQNWFPIGGDLYMYFTLSSAYSRYGMWGLTDDITILDTPKFEAIYEIMGTSSAASPVLVFPQYADGESGGQKSRTRVILRNNSNESDTGVVRFKSQAGEDLKEISFSIDAWGVVDLLTTGTGSLTVGPVEVYSDRSSQSSLEGTEIFESLGAFVSVNSSELVDAQQIFVSVNPDESTGVAIYNPNPEALTIRLVLIDHQGNLAASKDLSINAQHQLARFVDEVELFGDFFETRTQPFTGTLNLYVEDGRGIAVVGLILNKKTNGLIAVSPSNQTFPSTHVK